MAIKRSFILSSGIGVSADNLFVVNNTNSVSSTTGSIVLSGGIGIGQSASISGRLQMFNGANYTSFVSSATGNTVYTLPATSPATGSSVLQSTSAGVLSWVPMTATGGSSGLATTAENINTVAASTNANHHILFSPVNGGSGVAVSSDAGLLFNPASNTLTTNTFSAGVSVATVSASVSGSTASTNTSTGALVVTGGVGIGGSLNVNDKTRLNGDVYISSNSNDSFYSAGHGGVAGNWTVGANLQSGKYFLGLDLGLHPVGGNQSVVQTVWGMQLVGNSGVLPANYTASAVGANNAFGVLIPNQQAASVGLAVIAHASQTGDLQIWTTPSGLATTTLLSVRSNGQLYSYVSIASTSPTTGALVVTGSVGIGQSVSLSGRLQMFNGANYTAFVSSATGNTVYTLPATSPATGTSYLTSNSAGVMSWTAPTKTNYVLSFGAGFTPTANSEDSVSLNIPFAPDGTSKYYFVKRIEYRNETLSGGTGLSFYLQRHTSGNASWTITNTITAGSGASFLVGAAVYSSSFTTISSSAGVAGSVISGDYVRLFFTTVGSAANVSIAMTIEEQ